MNLKIFRIIFEKIVNIFEKVFDVFFPDFGVPFNSTRQKEL